MFNIPKFDWSLIKNSSPISILIPSSRNTGKTSLVQKIIKELDQKNKFYCGNFWTNEVYPQFPTNLQYKKFDENDLKKLIAFQKDNNRKGFNTNALVVFDFDKDIGFYKSKIIKDLFINHKNYNITIIDTTQKFKSVPLYIRVNYDYVFIFRDLSISHQKYLYDDLFINSFENFSDFTNTFIYSTSNQYNFMVIDKEDYVSYGTYELVKDYKCSLEPFYWKLDEIITKKYQEYLYLKDFTENQVKKIKIIPDFIKPKYYNSIKKLAQEKIEYKYPKKYTPSIPNYQVIEEIYPPLD